MSRSQPPNSAAGRRAATGRQDLNQRSQYDDYDRVRWQEPQFGSNAPHQADYDQGFAGRIEPGFDDRSQYHYPAHGQDAGHGGPYQSHPAGHQHGHYQAPYQGGTGFDHGQPQAAPFPPMHDPQAYDLSHYTTPPAAHGGQPAPAYEGNSYYEAAPGGYPQSAPTHYDGRGGHYEDPFGTGYGAPPAQGGERNLPARGEDYEDEYDEYDEEPRKGSRVWVLTLALIGSIAVGGGLAFGYKSIIGGSPQRGEVSVVRAGDGPMRVAPKDPGGRKVAGSDSKLMGRLEAEGSQSSSSGPDGVRKVSTYVVGPDGSISPTAPQKSAVTSSESSSGSSSAGAAIPGFEIVDGFGVSPAPREPALAPKAKVITVQPEREQAAVQTERPRIAVRKVTTLAPERQPVPEAPERRVPEQRAQAAIEQTRKVAVARPTAAPVERPATRGYVAVLSSKGSRMAALQVFADMREKYPSVLTGKVPDVQMSDQSTRGLGVVYRAVVGPPGSRQAASTVCRQLKDAGHSGCWVTAY